VFAAKRDPSGILTPAEIDEIRSSGRDPAEIAAQVEVLRGNRKSVPILRPARLDDGIQRFAAEESVALCRLHEQAAAAGRLSSFVPASGSGTRLFQSLVHAYQEKHIDRVRSQASQGHTVASDALAVLENIRDFALWDDLEGRGISSESWDEILVMLFADSETRYDELPKGLIPFHRYEHGVRTAFAEHINEAASLTRDARKICRIHFTVSDSHLQRFQKEWRREQPELERILDARFQVDFSIQSPATDTIGVDSAGSILRDGSGRIAFRPGGHGALLGNLAHCDGDVVLIKNIDNIARQELLAQIGDVRRKLCGLLLIIEHRVHEQIRKLRDNAESRSALDLLETQFGIRPSTPLLDEASRREFALDQLNRPLRVCGMIHSLTHTGGRPFWVNTDSRGPSLQIVESAEVDMANAGEKALFTRSEHFNPVDMACSIRDVDGLPFDLALFASADRALVAHKVIAGVPSRIFEHPGLWNGAMALWNTVFVEIPELVFNPVKSLSDLSTPGHRM
jgi:hypothetical protein